MATTAVWPRIDEECIGPALEQMGEKLDSAAGEVVLDFSSVRRVDEGALQAIEGLARVAAQKAVRVVLCGVDVHVYKVLKLARLTWRFSFRS